MPIISYYYNIYISSVFPTSWTLVPSHRSKVAEGTSSGKCEGWPVPTVVLLVLQGWANQISVASWSCMIWIDLAVGLSQASCLVMGENDYPTRIDCQLNMSGSSPAAAFCRCATTRSLYTSSSREAMSLAHFLTLYPQGLAATFTVRFTAF